MTVKLIIVMMVIGVLVGITKTAIGGLGLLCAAVIAQIMPAKESTELLPRYQYCSSMYLEPWNRAL